MESSSLMEMEEEKVLTSASKKKGARTSVKVNIGTI
jgi:hypothetical protein